MRGVRDTILCDNFKVCHALPEVRRQYFDVIHINCHNPNSNPFKFIYSYIFQLIVDPLKGCCYKHLLMS